MRWVVGPRAAQRRTPKLLPSQQMYASEAYKNQSQDSSQRSCLAWISTTTIRGRTTCSASHSQKSIPSMSMDSTSISPDHCVMLAIMALKLSRVTKSEDHQTPCSYRGAVAGCAWRKLRAQREFPGSPSKNSTSKSKLTARLIRLFSQPRPPAISMPRPRPVGEAVPRARSSASKMPSSVFCE